MMLNICSTNCSVVSPSFSPRFVVDVTFVAMEGLGLDVDFVCAVDFAFVGDNLDARLPSDSNAPKKYFNAGPLLKHH